MRTLDEILDQAKRLSGADRRRLIEELENNGRETPPDERRKAAMKRWLARSGTGHSDFTDVSENKNRYLADIYATKP